MTDKNQDVADKVVGEVEKSETETGVELKEPDQTVPEDNEEIIVLFSTVVGFTKINKTNYEIMTLIDVNKPWSPENNKLPPKVTLWRSIDPMTLGTFGDIIRPVCPNREMSKFIAIRTINLFMADTLCKLQPDLPKTYFGVHFDTIVHRLTNHFNDETRYSIGIYTDSDLITTNDIAEHHVPVLHFEISCWGYAVKIIEAVHLTDLGTEIREALIKIIIKETMEQIDLFGEYKVLRCTCREPPQWYKDNMTKYEKSIYSYATKSTGEPLDENEKIELQKIIEQENNGSTVKVHSSDNAKVV